MSLSISNYPHLATQRDKHVDVMFFWGILFVVIGHNYQLRGFFFHAYSFHMAFFFFISGYLFKIRRNYLDKVRFIIHKTKSQLLPYFVFNTLFFLLAYALRPAGINLTNDFSFYNFFIEPFISGHQNSFIIPCWFLLNLYIVNGLMQFTYLRESRQYIAVVLAILFVLALIGMHYGLNQYRDFRLTLVRTTFALLFFQIGIIFQTYKTVLDKYLFNPVMLLILYFVIIIIVNVYGELNYSIVWGNLETKRLLVPLVSTTLIIALSYGITYHLAQALKSNSLILVIGKHSFYIMALHLFIFFVVNYTFYLAGWIEKDALSNIYYRYNVERTFLLYQLPAILIPTLIGIIITKYKR